MEGIFTFKYSLGAGVGAENKDEKQGRENYFTVVGFSVQDNRPPLEIVRGD